MNKDTLKKIYNEIKKHDLIYIVRHIGPDPDAISSEVALRDIILLNFPNKKVYSLGASVSKFKYIGHIDKPLDFDYDKALVITLDVPNKSRIDGLNIDKFKSIIKIDHHPFVESFNGLEYIDVNACSTCEILLDLVNNTKLKINPEIARVLLIGIISDSNRFLFNPVDDKIFFKVGEVIKKYKINIQNIYKNYGKEPMIVPVLKDVSLEVVQGDYIAIMGPSGSGKTTLMNIIGCLDRASLGTYLFEDEDISEMNDDALSYLRLNKIGFVFQNFNLLSSETAQENVALPLIYAGIDKEKRNQRAIDVLNKVGLQDRISFKPSQLSGGQKQRVAIARAIINNPKILLADEPTGALDQASGKQVMELFKSLNDEGVTIIMITHDANVASHAKKIFHIIDGEIIENKQGGVL